MAAAPDARVGSAGPPLPSAQVAIADDCSLLVRGLLAMAGYRNRPEATAAAIDADSRLHTAAQIDDLYTTKEKP
jgi:long-subunit acyl-CoA synthetase (AMP-forming)